MQDDGVTFKGTVNCLTIIMKDTLDFDTLLKLIENKLASAGRFFKGASIMVKYRGRKLSKDEEKVVYDLLSDKSGAQIRNIEEDKEEIVTLQNIITDSKDKKQDKCKTTVRYSYFKDLEEGPSRFYKGTVRSGQLVSFDGNLVIIGEVNPGGEVAATGNVVVMGSLRGIVHAGSDGNKEAVVVAFNLQPTQLRIADVITRSPDEKATKGQNIPEMAFVKDEMVYIERYLHQR